MLGASELVPKPHVLRDRLTGLGLAGTGLLALAGACLAFVILYADWPFPATARPFTTSGAYFLWLVLICGQVALWAALLPTLGRAVAKLSPAWACNRRTVVGMVAAFALLVALPLAVGQSLRANPDYPLPGHILKVNLITGIGVAVALVGVVAVALLHGAIGAALRSDGTVAPTELERYFSLRATLLQLLAVEGAILSAAIVATGALRHAIVGYTGEPASFPKETLLAYGTYLSAVIAMLYAPVYAQLLALGRTLRDRLVSFEDGAGSLVDKLEQQQKLDALLGLELTANASFKSGVLILAPLSSSLIGLVFGS